MTVNIQHQLFQSYSSITLNLSVLLAGSILVLYSEAVILTTEMRYGYLITLVHSNENNLDNVYIVQHADSLHLQLTGFEGALYSLAQRGQPSKELCPFISQSSLANRQCAISGQLIELGKKIDTLVLLPHFGGAAVSSGFLSPLISHRGHSWNDLFQFQAMQLKVHGSGTSESSEASCSPFDSPMFPRSKLRASSTLCTACQERH